MTPPPKPQPPPQKYLRHCNKRVAVRVCREQSFTRILRAESDRFSPTLIRFFCTRHFCVVSRTAVMAADGYRKPRRGALNRAGRTRLFPLHPFLPLSTFRQCGDNIERTIDGQSSALAAVAGQTMYTSRSRVPSTLFIEK